MTASDIAAELSPRMRAALADPLAPDVLKSTRRALRIRGLTLPRGRSVLGDRVFAAINEEGITE